MFITKLNLIPFFDGEGGPSGVPDPNEARQNLEDLNQDDGDEHREEEEHHEEEEEHREEEEEHREEGEEEEEEHEEEGEAELEGVVVHGLAFRDLKKAYPDILKKFPQLGEIIARERDLSEVFSTKEDAQSAAADADFLHTLEGEILGGSSKRLVESVHKEDPENFKKFVLDFSARVMKMDNMLYSDMIQPGVVRILHGAMNAAQQAGNKNLENSVKFISKWLFNDYDLPRVKDLELNEGDKETDGVKRERAQLANEIVDRFRSDTLDAGNEALSKMIREAIPDDKKLSKRMIEVIINDTGRDIDRTLGADRGHVRTMDSIFKRAQRSNYPRAAQREMITAYLRAAKPLVKAKLARAMAEVLGTRKPREKDERETKPGRQNFVREGQSGSRFRRVGDRTLTARDVNWRETSDMDILNDNYVPKK